MIEPAVLKSFHSTASPSKKSVCRMMNTASTSAAISYMNTPVPVGDAIMFLCIGCTSIKVFLWADTYLYRFPGRYVVYKYTDLDDTHLQHGTHTALAAAPIIFNAVAVGAHKRTKAVGGPSLIFKAVSG